MTVTELADKFRSSGLSLAEVTGGEPLLQEAVPLLLRKLNQYGETLLETNGSCDISPVPLETVTIMDIKTPSSGQAEAVDLENIKRLRRHDEVKFVVSNQADYDWSRSFVMRYNLLNLCAAVLISPVFGELEPAELAVWLTRDRLPLRLNLQLHKYIWPTRQRGV